MNIYSLIIGLWLSHVIVTGYLFDTVKPVIYLKTDHYVVTGIKKFTLHFKFTSPCSMLPNASTLADKPIEKFDNLIFLNMKMHCEALYNDTWLPAVDLINQPRQFYEEEDPNDAIRSVIKEPEVDDYMKAPTVKPLTEKQVEDIYKHRYEMKKIVDQDEQITSIKTIKRDSGNPSNHAIQPHELGMTSLVLRSVGDELKETALGVLGGILGSSVSNLVTSIYEHYDPNSKTNRITRIEQQMTREEKKLRRIAGVTEDLVDTVANLTHLISQGYKIMNRIAELVPKVVQSSIAINTGITQSAERLTAIMNQRSRRNEVSVKNLRKLLNTPFLKELNDEDTTMQSITLGAENIITFEFRALVRSKDTHVFKIRAFDHWDDLTEETMKKKRYAGPQFVLYNATAHCVRYIPEPDKLRVPESCFAQNYDDGFVGNWEVIESTTNIKKTKKSAQVIQGGNFNYIYCYPFNITIEGETHKCPIKPFRLSINTGFVAVDVRHESSQVVMDFVQHYDKIGFEALHNSHLEESSDLADTERMIDDLRHYKKELKEIKEEKQESIIIRYYSTAFWAIIMAILLLIAMVIYASYLVVSKWKEMTTRDKGASEPSMTPKSTTSTYKQPREAPPTWEAIKAKFTTNQQNPTIYPSTSALPAPSEAFKYPSMEHIEMKHATNFTNT